MLYLEGQVINIYKSPDFKDKDTGTVKPGQHRIQIMTDIFMTNGETRKDLVSLTISHPEKYSVGEVATIPVGYMARGNQVYFFGAEK